MNLADYILGNLPPPPPPGAGRLVGHGFPDSIQAPEAMPGKNFKVRLRGLLGGTLSGNVRTAAALQRYREAMSGKGPMTSAAVGAAVGKTQDGAMSMLKKLAARGLVKVHPVNHRFYHYEWIGDGNACNEFNRCHEIGPVKEAA